MKRLLLFALVVLFSVTTLSAQNANTRYRGSAKPGDIVYSNAYDGFVNMRQTASYKAAKVGEFKNGTGAVMLENLGEWMKIEVSGIVGYVPSRLLSLRPFVVLSKILYDKQLYYLYIVSPSLKKSWREMSSVPTFFISLHQHWFSWAHGPTEIKREMGEIPIQFPLL